MAQLRGESTKSADLTVPKSSEPPSGAEAVLQEVPVKYLRFAEDVRPPYIGTYTKCPAGVSDSKISRNPFSRVLPATNYDYDSEVEWEEPGEGEDLDSEGEEDMGEDEDNDDMDGFLDDEDAGDGIGGNKRRHIMGDLEPKLTGLCWEDADGKVQGNTGGVDLESMKLQVLLPTITGPIDPYSTAYWPSSNASSDQQLYNMNPPRVPLNALSGINSLQVGTSHFSSPFVSKSNSRQSNVKSTTTNTSSGPKKTIPADLMMDFKAAIEGSDLTKAGLIEVLKKKFPKTSKDAIKDALGTVAERVGAKEADKRWIIKTD
ncbi:hypothetical protein MMC09_001109 [Bachmanniomyces sp. S44760]|nr:hypothetical protein [Bachmanniomyces sp. S44760]